MSERRLPTIRASEVGEYVYCARSWWLRRVAELEPEGRERREQGIRAHRRHGRVVVVSWWLVILAALLLAAGIWMLVYASR